MHYSTYIQLYNYIEHLGSSKKKHLEQYQIMNLLSFLTLHSNLPFRYLRSAEFVSLRGPMRLWRGPGWAADQKHGILLLLPLVCK